MSGMSLRRMSRRGWCWLGAILPLALLVSVVGAQAQTYPDKPIKLVIPYAVGGSTDLTGRMLARSLSDRLGQPIVVESRPGAGGSVGHEFVAKSSADGYTLLFSAAGPLTVTPHIYSKLGYDPVKAFEPVTLVATQPLLLVIKPSLQAQSVADLVRLAKSQPGKLSYGSFGYGSAAHLAGEYFKMLAGVDIVHVPYKGSAPALTDLMAGQFDLMFDVFSTSAPLVEGDKLRAIAITSNDRSPQFPNVPTMQQAGVKGFEAGTWFGLLVPTGTPRPIIDALSVATNKSLEEKEVRDNLASQGATIAGGTPEQFGQFFQAEYEKWQKIVKLAGITPN